MSITLSNHVLAQACNASNLIGDFDMEANAPYGSTTGNIGVYWQTDGTGVAAGSPHNTITNMSNYMQRAGLDLGCVPSYGSTYHISFDLQLPTGSNLTYAGVNVKIQDSTSATGPWTDVFSETLPASFTATTCNNGWTTYSASFSPTTEFLLLVFNINVVTGNYALFDNVYLQETAATVCPVDSVYTAPATCSVATGNLLSGGDFSGSTFATTWNPSGGAATYTFPDASGENHGVVAQLPAAAVIHQTYSLPANCNSMPFYYSFDVYWLNTAPQLQNINFYVEASSVSFYSATLLYNNLDSTLPPPTNTPCTNGWTTFQGTIPSGGITSANAQTLDFYISTGFNSGNNGYLVVDNVYFGTSQVSSNCSSAAVASTCATGNVVDDGTFGTSLGTANFSSYWQTNNSVLYDYSGASYNSGNKHGLVANITSSGTLMQFVDLGCIPASNSTYYVHVDVNYPGSVDDLSLYVSDAVTGHSYVADSTFGTLDNEACTSGWQTYQASISPAPSGQYLSFYMKDSGSAGTAMVDNVYVGASLTPTCSDDTQACVSFGQLIQNPGFETSNANWQGSFTYYSTGAPHNQVAQIGTASGSSVYQSVNLGCAPDGYSYVLSIDISFLNTAAAQDDVTVTVKDVATQSIVFLNVQLSGMNATACNNGWTTYTAAVNNVYENPLYVAIAQYGVPTTGSVLMDNVYFGFPPSEIAACSADGTYSGSTSTGSTTATTTTATTTIGTANACSCPSNASYSMKSFADFAVYYPVEKF